LKFSYQKLVYTLFRACYMPCQPIPSTYITINFAEEQNLSSLLRFQFFQAPRYYRPTKCPKRSYKDKESILCLFYSIAN